MIISIQGVRLSTAVDFNSETLPIIGLRVAKEDKHTNLIRGRAMKAQALAQAQAEAAAKVHSFYGTASPLMSLGRRERRGAYIPANPAINET